MAERSIILVWGPVSSELLFRSSPPTLVCHRDPGTCGQFSSHLADPFSSQVHAPNKGGRPRAPSSTPAWSGVTRGPRLGFHPPRDPDAALRPKWARSNPSQPRRPRLCLAHSQPQPLQRPESNARGSSGNWLGGLNQNQACNSAIPWICREKMERGETHRSPSLAAPDSSRGRQRKQPWGLKVSFLPVTQASIASLFLHPQWFFTSCKIPDSFNSFLCQVF